MKFAFVFPGQGSQSLGMMQAYGDMAIVQQTFDEASEVLAQNLWALATHGPEADLDLTVNTQPLMLAADVAVWRLWQHLGGPLPSLLAGHSLGEYAALVAAGALSFPQAVRLVRLRASAMQQAVPAGIGAMAAVLGMEVGPLRDLCADISTSQALVQIANYNAPGQLVVAGHKGAVDRLAEAAKNAGAKRVVLLPVSAPFHCLLMRPASSALAAQLRQESIQSPNPAVIHNVDVKTHADPPAIAQALADQVDQPVRWIETITSMAEQGITHVVECGPGRILTGLVKRIVPNLIGLALSDSEAMNKTLTMLRS